MNDIPYSTLNQNVTEDDLQKTLDNIIGFRDLLISQAKEIMMAGNSLLHKDIFINAISNRAISTIHAFLTLAETNNYLVSTPLIRFQLDNCLRLHASVIVADQDKFVTDFMSGERIDKMKDKNNQKMNDRYLAEQFNVLYPGMLLLYQATSEYVHLSYKHLNPFMKVREEGGIRKANFSVGVIDVYPIANKVDFAHNFLIVTNIIYQMLDKYKMGKLAFFAQLEKDSKN